MAAASAGHCFRYWSGLGLLTVCVLLPIAALLFPWLGLPAASTSLPVGLMIAGGPELICLAAIALLGGDGYRRLRGEQQRTVSKLRYYGGLTYCLLNSLPIFLYAYLPQVMPGGITRYVILALADLSFIASLFLMGGGFWEKFRRLFIWEDGR